MEVKDKQKEAIVIGTVKRMKHIYGIDLLIKSVAKLVKYLQENRYNEIANRIKLLIVGDGPELTELQQLADEQGIGDITEFVGAVPNEQVPVFINQLDIYCAFSRSESFGVAVLEASACAVPVVVSNVGGLPEVVQHGKTGYIVDIDVMDEMVEKLFKLVIDKNKRNEFGRNGRSFVQSNYEWDHNVTQMENIYLQMQ
ncbi:glycosyltransferase family 4 protein [Virgibacillus sp. 179-BFC.A HS]|uniref:Glycosyltransferase family 4 protein n=1 Tax=Tigheibacillus jepli TaxID=3035914 RepID=A0ABU5CEF6_9BACI|nr:glycosyltransferase family 4 protein [Virgibacillus sp. 179-BFC.A HS]MDY0404722.1 glycosyltransferase family 4 protein [Virgibacillus sp. 179-BFC.A HS]